MEILRQILAGFRQERVESRDYYDVMYWIRMLAAYQMVRNYT